MRYNLPSSTAHARSHLPRLVGEQLPRGRDVEHLEDRGVVVRDGERVANVDQKGVGDARVAVVVHRLRRSGIREIRLAQLHLASQCIGIVTARNARQTGRVL
eukprot:6199236-Pleurochrysis_carterae.AAC.2